MYAHIHTYVCTYTHTKFINTGVRREITLVQRGRSRDSDLDVLEFLPSSAPYVCPRSQFMYTVYTLYVLIICPYTHTYGPRSQLMYTTCATYSIYHIALDSILNISYSLRCSAHIDLDALYSIYLLALGALDSIYLLKYAYVFNKSYGLRYSDTHDMHSTSIPSHMSSRTQNYASTHT